MKIDILEFIKLIDSEYETDELGLQCFFDDVLPSKVDYFSISHTRVNSSLIEHLFQHGNIQYQLYIPICQQSGYLYELATLRVGCVKEKVIIQYEFIDS